MLGNEGKIQDAVHLSTFTDRGRNQRGREESHRRVSTPKYLPTGYDVASGQKVILGENKHAFLS